MCVCVCVCTALLCTNKPCMKKLLLTLKEIFCIYTFLCLTWKSSRKQMNEGLSKGKDLVEMNNIYDLKLMHCKRIVVCIHSRTSQSSPRRFTSSFRSNSNTINDILSYIIHILSRCLYRHVYQSKLRNTQSRIT